ncbi:MAG: 3-phosphoshikimate 1-carboxyvinyltransferase, partial [Clostridiales bacterium]|nr:3-phosphoshikimate 1-carboxyvinyltransferase [Clostridiales bacterium]
MNVRLSPTKLKGSITIPPSKSMSHRALICAALSEGESVVENIILSDDIKATISAMSELGANFKVVENQVHVSGITIPPSVASIDCNESGSTLRFIIPIAAALGVATTFFGNGKLPERPITPFLRELPKKNIAFAYNGTMPFAINGMLKAGTYELEGDISSQFISGLLFSLPLLDGDSQINLTSPLQSKPYVDMTIDCMNKYGVQVTESEDKYLIEGNQIYSLDRFEVEGDYSQAAFFLVANALGSDIQCGGLDKDSLQGDKKIIEIIDSIKR